MQHHEKDRANSEVEHLAKHGCSKIEEEDTQSETWCCVGMEALEDIVAESIQHCQEEDPEECNAQCTLHNKAVP